MPLPSVPLIYQFVGVTTHERLAPSPQPASPLKRASRTFRPHIEPNYLLRAAVEAATASLLAISSVLPEMIALVRKARQQLPSGGKAPDGTLSPVSGAHEEEALRVSLSKMYPMGFVTHQQSPDSPRSQARQGLYHNSSVRQLQAPLHTLRPTMRKTTGPLDPKTPARPHEHPPTLWPLPSKSELFKSPLGPPTHPVHSSPP